MSALLLADVAKIPSPSVSYHALSPILIILGAGATHFLLIALFGRTQRFFGYGLLGGVGAGLLVVAVVLFAGRRGLIAESWRPAIPVASPSWRFWKRRLPIC